MGLLMWALVSLFGFAYDDGGFRGLFWWIAEVFAIPFLIAGKILSLIWEGRGAVKTLAILVLGMALCALLDFGLQKIAQKGE